MEPTVDLTADLNAQDDDGLGWSTLGDAREPSIVRPGAMLVAGNKQAKAVVRIVSIDDDHRLDLAQGLRKHTAHRAHHECRTTMGWDYGRNGNHRVITSALSSAMTETHRPRIKG